MYKSAPRRSAERGERTIYRIYSDLYWHNSGWIVDLQWLIVMLVVTGAFFIFPYIGNFIIQNWHVVWWWLEHDWMIFQYIGNFIIPIELTNPYFSEGYTTNQDWNGWVKNESQFPTNLFICRTVALLYGPKWAKGVCLKLWPEDMAMLVKWSWILKFRYSTHWFFIQTQMQGVVDSASFIQFREIAASLKIVVVRSYLTSIQGDRHSVVGTPFLMVT